MKTAAEFQRDAKTRRICTLISACKLTANRNDILWLWGVTQFDDLNQEQLHELSMFMEDAYRGKTTNASECIRMWRSRCLKRLTGAHDDPNEKARGLNYPNEWILLNRVTLKSTKKLLYMLSEAELMAYHRQLCRIRETWWHGKNSRAEAVVTTAARGGGKGVILACMSIGDGGLVTVN